MSDRQLKISISEDLLTALRKETAELDIKISTFVNNLIAKELGDKVGAVSDEEEVPTEYKVCKVRINGPDADYIKRMSEELHITPSQYIGKLIAEHDSTTINISFLDDFMEEFRTMENHIRKLCYYASRDEKHQVSEQMIRDTLKRLDELVELFCQIYKELIKTKNSIIKKIEKGAK